MGLIQLVIRLSFLEVIKGRVLLKLSLFGLKCNQRTIPTASSLPQSPTRLIKEMTLLHPSPKICVVNGFRLDSFSETPLNLCHVTLVSHHHLSCVTRNSALASAFPGIVSKSLAVKAFIPFLLHYRTAYFLFLEFEEVLKVVVVSLDHVERDCLYDVHSIFEVLVPDKTSKQLVIETVFIPGGEGWGVGPLLTTVTNLDHSALGRCSTAASTCCNDYVVGIYGRQEDALLDIHHSNLVSRYRGNRECTEEDLLVQHRWTLF
ncbi:hypothetical protein Tco_0885994 [Tanacetum coccineum]